MEIEEECVQAATAGSCEMKWSDRKTYRSHSPTFALYDYFYSQKFAGALGSDWEAISNSPLTADHLSAPG